MSNGITHTYNSWGRTRSPKNITGANGQSVALEPNTDRMLTAVPTYKGVGYPTENQRYLHVLVTDLNDTDPSGDAVSIFGYCHAFERWFEIGETHMITAVDNTAVTAAAITVGDSNRAVNAQLPSDREYRIYEIVGIDRVAFVHVDDTEVDVFAACSTF